VPPALLGMGVHGALVPHSNCDTCIHRYFRERVYFAEEMTALQHVGKERGVSVIISSKFHAEMAGERIEYSWGVSKCVYRGMPLHLVSKNGKVSFKALVNECTSRDVLSPNTVRKLSQWARAYICAF
jgi:hypothetical protein